jgi:hypothetical protein
MALPKPNQLRYRFCDIPPNVEASLQALVDEFYVDMQEIDQGLDDYALNDVPAILATEQEMADLVQEMLRGSPVPELSSLQALQDSLKLINPKLPELDPVVVSLDERKLGAIGMVLINGKMFAAASGSDFDTFRQIWYAAQGEYKAFLALGDGIADSDAGTFTLLQYIPGKPAMPFINRKWSVLDTLNPYQKLSKYVQPLIWTESIEASAANYARLKEIGYDDIQVSQIFAGEQPRASDETRDALFSISLANINDLAALYTLPHTDEQRKPKWQNEVKFFTDSLTAYLAYRKETNRTSYIFNTDVWERSKAVFNEKDFKELFENRPEVQNILVPTDDATIGNLLLSASQLPVGSTAINSYMIKLPNNNRDTFSYEERLLSIGASLLKSLLKDKNASSGSVRLLVEELKGDSVTEADITKPKKATATDVKKVLKSGSKMTPGNKTDAYNKAITNSPDPDKTEDALAAAAVGSDFLENPTPTQGLPTEENFMTVLFRRVDWRENFKTCTKEVTKETNKEAKAEDKFTKFGPALNNNIKTKPGGSANPDDLYGKDANILNNPKNLGGNKGKPDLSGLPTKGSDRRDVILNQESNPTTIKQQFTYNCTPKFQNGFLDQLSKLTGTVTQDIIVACEALKRALFMIQNIIDNLIAKMQVVLDQVLGVLERLLTLNLNIGGALGFDTSLIKCSWSVDFGLKLDLFGALLKFLNDKFDKIFGPIRKGLRFIQDIITKAICVPVRLLELFLGGVNALLGLIGCSLKDIQLPQAILDLLKALLYTFDLRTLVLRQGYDAFFEMSVNPKSGARPFNGLTQFAELCQSVTMKDAVNSVQSVTLVTAASAPGFIAEDLQKKADDLMPDTTSISVTNFI